MNCNHQLSGKRQRPKPAKPASNTLKALSSALILIVPLTILISAQKVRAESVCVTSFEKEVEPIRKMISERKSPARWKNYGRFLKKFSGCLDGAWAEVVQSISEDGLANDWKAFTSYVTNQKPSKAVLVNMTTGYSVEVSDGQNLKKIRANAKANCPKSLRNFCREILSETSPNS